MLRSLDNKRLVDVKAELNPLTTTFDLYDPVKLFNLVPRVAVLLSIG